MGWFWLSCFCPSPKVVKKIEGQSHSRHSPGPSETGKEVVSSDPKDKVSRFTFRELLTATGNLNEFNLIGQGGFGKVYKGRLKTGQLVAVKTLDHNGIQGNQEFDVEVLMLSNADHFNLVTLFGYCNDGHQRMLVYEYMPMGSLEDHLFIDRKPHKKPLEWDTRIKIALGAARGLQYLHCEANPPVIHRDLKSSNILLDNEFNPKLSDFGLAKLGPVGGKTHVSTRVMGTQGYCAPEYAMSGRLTLKSDIYSFGVVLLELLTGRRAIDYTKKKEEQNLVTWSRTFLKDPSRFIRLVDPLLQGRFNMRCLHQAITIIVMCIHEQASVRPLISDVVVAFEYLASQPYSSGSTPDTPSPALSPLQQNGLNFSIGR